MVGGEAAATVKFDRRVAVVYFEVEDFGAVLAGGLFGEVEELGADSLPAVRGLDEEFVYPGADATVFEAVVEADDEVADGGGIFADDVGHAVDRVLHEFDEIGADRGLMERFFPRIVTLHVAHHLENGFEVSDSGLVDRDGHGGTRERQENNLRGDR